MVEIGIPGISGAEEIGRGAFGRVFRAQQADLNRMVAVKVLAGVDCNEEACARFAREARAIGRMSGHPNIVSLFSQGTSSDGKPFLIMEYCSGGSLGDRIRDGAAMSWQEATEVVVAVAGALHTAHEAGILHRDVKPANVLLDSFGTPKLADFGIARINVNASETATGMLAGSPAHLAPELVAGGNPSAASDLYSLASTLFTLLTGQPPFHRDRDSSIFALLHRVCAETPADLQCWGVPAPVADLVAAALAKDPAQRPSSCLEFAEALQEARRSLGLPPASCQAYPRRSEDTTDSARSPGAPLVPLAAESAAAVVEDRRRSGRTLVLLCWITVLVCLILGGLVAWDHSHQVIALTAAYARSDGMTNPAEPRTPG